MKCNHDLSTDKNCLLQVPIFNHLENKYLEEILPLLNSKKFKKGDEVVNPFDNTSDLYILRSGYVKVFKLSENGKEHILGFLTPGEFLGELNIFTNTNHDTYAVALEDLEVCMISRKDFEKVISKYPSISLEIIKELSNRLNDAEEKLTYVSTSNVKVRVVKYLLTLLNPIIKTDKVVIPMKKKDLSSYLSISPETLSRNLKQLEDEKLIKQINNRTIKLLNINELESLVE